MPLRVFAYVVLGLLGAASGTAGIFLHAADADVVGLSLPLGLVVSLAAAGALFLAGAALTGTRAGTVVAVVAWFLAVVAFAPERPEGDLLLADNAAGFAFLLLGALIGGVAVGLPAWDGRGRRP